MLEKAIVTTRRGKYPNVQYARFADDLVVLIDSHPRHEWLRGAVEKRLREEMTKLRVEINEEKSRKVDLSMGGSFGFLGGRNAGTSTEDNRSSRNLIFRFLQPRF
jgi:RNA-directed DNA polymerase